MFFCASRGLEWNAYVLFSYVMQMHLTCSYCLSVCVFCMLLLKIKPSSAWGSLEGMFMEPFLCCQCPLKTVPNEFRPLWKYSDWMLFSLYVIPAQIGYLVLEKITLHLPSFFICNPQIWPFSVYKHTQPFWIHPSKDTTNCHCRFLPPFCSNAIFSTYFI